MNVLSLFDGISAGQLALKRVGIEVDNYFASEVDKYAIKVTQSNFPNTVQIGNVEQVSAVNLPKIDLLIGGSPCQGFSPSGKGLNFEDPRSRLFFEYVRLLNEVCPKYFLLENVKMKKEWVKIISDMLGTEPVEINSSLVSAQNRKRLYWTNIPNVTIPEDKGILLKDVIEQDYDGIYVLPRGYNKGGVQSYNYKSPSITTSSWQHNFFIYTNKSSNGLVQEGFIDTNKQGNRVYSIAGKSCTITSNSGGKAGNGNCLIIDGGNIRKFTEIEVERLQTFPDNYTFSVSSNQRYKLLGNAWTVDVITHILGSLRNIDE